MQKADYLLRLMKQRTDAIAATDEKLQQFLIWVNEKYLSVEVPYKPAAVRAFYFALAFAFAFERNLDPGFVPALARDLDRALDPTLERDIISALDRGFVPTLDNAFDRTLELALDAALVRDLDGALELALEQELRQALQELKEEVPNRNSNREISKQWWHAKSQGWREQLRAVMITHRNICHDWQFSERQKASLRQYYDANRLLVDCLNSSCNVTPAVRSHVEETLLLPIAEIERRGSC
jgi:predicted NACHT family NTPase